MQGLEGRLGVQLPWVSAEAHQAWLTWALGTGVQESACSWTWATADFPGPRWREEAGSHSVSGCQARSPVCRAGGQEVSILTADTPAC